MVRANHATESTDRQRLDAHIAPRRDPTTRRRDDAVQARRERGGLPATREKAAGAAVSRFAVRCRSLARSLAPLARGCSIDFQPERSVATQEANTVFSSAAAANDDSRTSRARARPLISRTVATDRVRINSAAARSTGIEAGRRRTLDGGTDRRVVRYATRRHAHTTHTRYTHAHTRVGWRDGRQW